MIVNSAGTWLKRLEHVPVRMGRLPGVYVPSYRLNWFQLDEHDGALRVRYRVVPKEAPGNLTWLERLLILGRQPTQRADIPAETRVAGEHRAAPGVLQ